MIIDFYHHLSKLLPFWISDLSLNYLRKDIRFNKTQIVYVLTLVVLFSIPGHRFRHSMAIRSPRPPSAMDLEEARRLATVKRSSSMPATPPSTCDFGSWRGSSDLASSGTNSAQGHVKLRRTFSQRAKDFFRRSRSTENTLEDSASSQTSRARSKSPFTWLFRGSGSKDGGDATTLTSSSCGGSGSLNQEPVVLRKSRDRAKKTPRTLATTNGNASIESQQSITTPDGDITPMPSSSVKPPQLSSARPPTDVDCPNYKETLHALGQVLSRRHSVIPQTFGGAVPLQGIPVQKAKVRREQRSPQISTEYNQRFQQNATTDFNRSLP